MFVELFEKIGMNQNAAKVLNVLVCPEELTSSEIAVKAKVNRRNVYDILRTMVRDGWVYERESARSFVYRSIPPNELIEKVKQDKARKLPLVKKLVQLYETSPKPSETVAIYKGIEGWKNYMQDILDQGQDDFILAAKGVWGDPKILGYVKEFAKNARQKGIRFHVLVDFESREKFVLKQTPLVTILPSECRLLPKGFSTQSGIEIFGNEVVMISDDSEGVLHDELSLTVIKNQDTADSFRTWFKLIWGKSKKIS